MLLTIFVWLLTRIIKEVCLYFFSSLTELLLIKPYFKVKENRMRLLKGSTRNLVQPNGITALPDPRKDSRNSLGNIAQASHHPHARTNSVRLVHFL